jgi:hypothetical protein
MESTKQDFFKEIRKQLLEIKKGKRASFNFLGYLECRNIPDSVKSYFSAGDRYIMYDWVNGNEYLKEKLAEIEEKNLNAKEVYKLLFVEN